MAYIPYIVNMKHEISFFCMNVSTFFNFHLKPSFDGKRDYERYDNEVSKLTNQIETKFACEID